MKNMYDGNAARTFDTQLGAEPVRDFKVVPDCSTHNVIKMSIPKPYKMKEASTPEWDRMLQPEFANERQQDRYDFLTNADNYISGLQERLDSMNKTMIEYGFSQEIQ